MEEGKPIAKYRAGAVTCALWQNQVSVNGQPTTMLKASISRRYQDRHGTWKSSESFSRNEIPLAIYVLQKAFEAMVQKTAEEEIVEAVEEVARQ